VIVTVANEYINDFYKKHMCETCMQPKNGNITYYDDKIVKVTLMNKTYILYQKPKTIKTICSTCRRVYNGKSLGKL
jgi:hypothetical protein